MIRLVLYSFPFDSNPIFGDQRQLVSMKKYLISRVDQIKYDLEELPVHGELVNRLHMSKEPYRKRREEGIPR